MNRGEIIRAQMEAAAVKCCTAGQVSFPLSCPWHARTDPMFIHWDSEHAASWPFDTVFA